MRRLPRTLGWASYTARTSAAANCVARARRRALRATPRGPRRARSNAVRATDVTGKPPRLVTSSPRRVSPAYDDAGRRLVARNVQFNRDVVRDPAGAVHAGCRQAALIMPWRSDHNHAAPIRSSSDGVQPRGVHARQQPTVVRRQPTGSLHRLPGPPRAEYLHAHIGAKPAEFPSPLIHSGIGCRAAGK